MFQEYKKYKSMLCDCYSDKYNGFLQIINNSENQYFISFTEDFNYECHNKDENDEDKEDNERSPIQSE